MNRRELLRTSALLGAVLAGGRRAFAATSRYGALAPVADEETGLPLLKLPEGFRYRSFGWEGDPMADGTRTPDRHDGMAVLPHPRQARIPAALQQLTEFLRPGGMIRNFCDGRCDAGNPNEIPFGESLACDPLAG